MKKTVLFLTILLLSFVSYAQTATGFNYKALVTDNGTPVANATINVRATFKAGTSIKWREVHSNVQTDANGIFSIALGEGTRLSGETSFDKVNWNSGNLNLTVEVDTGSGYQTLINNEYFKMVPYAKEADRVRPGSYSVIVQNSSSNNGHGVQVINNGSGSLSESFRLSHNADDWYVFMKNNNDLCIANDGTSVFEISDTDNSVWLRGLLKVNEDGIRIKSQAAGNYFYISSASDGLAFKYNSATAIKLHGSAYVEVPGKLTAPTSGNNDMKAYAYGEWFGGSSRHLSDNVSITNPSTGHYTITFTPGLGSTDDYIVVANLYTSTGFVKINKATTAFFITTYDTSGTVTNKSFTFVVYKK